MSFKISWDVDNITTQLRSAAREAGSPYNDGFSGMMCKRDLWQIKCILDDLYRDLPTFSGEEKWEEERTFEILKRK
jgi:hypothetical protein